jgi:hypothetical protein
MKTAATKQKPIESSIDERIATLHEEIDKLVEQHVDVIAAGAPGVPKGVLRGLALARAEGGSGCRCGVYKHLFGKKA